MIWQLLLYSYLITTGIGISTMPFRSYYINKDQYGKRASMITAFQVAGLCFIPYLAFCALIYTSYKSLTKKLNGWVKADPTSPTNKNDPNFKPSPKKEKKFEAIRDRFDILDL